MKYRTFGKTGIQISELAFGCGAVGGLMINASEDVRQRAFDRAIAQGINWFDTAASYGKGQSETHLGDLLSSTAERPYVSTKLTIDTTNGDIAGQVEASVAASLRRLRSDSVTLLQLHNPVAQETDGRSLGVSEVLKPSGVLDAMERMREQGLCEHVGITGLGHAPSVIEVIESGRIASTQVYYNLLNPSAGTDLPPTWPHYSFAGIIAACEANGVAAMNIRVFSAGVIATDARHGRERPLTAGDTVETETAKTQHLLNAIDIGADTRAQTALRFALAEPRMSCVVVGLAEAEHLDEAIEAAESGPLDEGAMEAIAGAWSTFR